MAWRESRRGEVGFDRFEQGAGGAGQEDDARHQHSVSLRRAASTARNPVRAGLSRARWEASGIRGARRAAESSETTQASGEARMARVSPEA
jgi:hypothetical protein